MPIGRGIVAEPHGLNRAHVDGPDDGPQTQRDSSEIGLDTREQLVEGALRRLGQPDDWLILSLRLTCPARAGEPCTCIDG